MIIEPSGDKTGKADLREIQKANDARPDCVELRGTFYVNDTLRTGDESNLQVAPVPLLGAPFAKIVRVATAHDDYVLRMFGTPNAARPMLANIMFECEWKSRGVLVTGGHYYPDFSNVTIRKSNRVGLDALGCYCSSWHNILILGGRGYGARFATFNSADLRGIRIGSMQPTDWPDNDDDVAIYEDGTPWNIAATQGKLAHCALYLDGNAFEAHNITFESNKLRDDPLLQLAASSSEIRTIRCEANVARRCKVRVVGSEYTDRGHHNHIRNIYVRDSGSCANIVEYSGNTSDNVVEVVNTTAISITPTP